MYASLNISVCISPAGRPYVNVLNNHDTPQTHEVKLLSPLESRLLSKFSPDSDYAKGFLALASAELQTPLPPDLDFLRNFAKNYMTRLCHSPETLGGNEQVIHEIPILSPPSVADFELLLAGMPPMTGAEYLTSTVLEEWWRELDRCVREEIANHKKGAADWIQQQNPVWKTVGRVTFHLAENKRDEQYPFAFMATYTETVSAASQPVQLPLAKALQAYALAKDRMSLLRLLQPITNAAKKCDWLQTMTHDQTIYQPRAWTIKQAYRMLQDIPLLEESGLIIRIPDWWQKRQTTHPRVKVSLGTTNNKKTLTAAAMLKFQIETVYNDEPLTPEELENLLASDEHLIRLRGQWVEIDKEQLWQTLEHWKKIDQMVCEDGISFYEGMRLLAGLTLDGKNNASEKEAAFRNWSEVVPTAQFADLLAAMRDPSRLDSWEYGIKNLNAALRPYQEVGVRWLNFMAQLRLGTCLADDMGLGKTIQIIAFLLIQQKETAVKNGTNFASLLIVPASLLGNWESEIRRFAPTLNVYIAHGSGHGVEEPENIGAFHVVMTTYGMLDRVEWIKSKEWRHVIIDEAQAIKNAGTRQSKAVKSVKTSCRIALTGTPIENRLSDLWSLFDFINPGLLGTNTAFHKFIKSITQQNNSAAYAPLRQLVQPYILRRLKIDKSIISDLPDKTEVTAWCGLSKEQTKLYAQSVHQLAADLKKNDEGIKRRGMILSYLMRFKQICNHPAQWSGSGDYTPAKSGKFLRLREICEEIASRQEKVLIFTQFREITEPLAYYLQTIFQKSGLILDGSTAIAKRRHMVEAFQSESGPPFFILSLKAGGTGLNLTKASHVVHFDRWWNPAVENQATDRAFRIGQKKNVLVHKFVCRGTIEEKIDELIESKKAIAGEIVESGGDTLVTEMSDSQLLQMVSLDLEKCQDG
ncbi:MAG: DEAD/DEAH box helicase [Planctomycetaceae bacterium]|jgi:non-specific serine/threonine protein kinase|nr:DEAD/DEAH box helicase [Planctomycetaceae bacterium]